MHTNIRVLVFPAGEANALEIHDALCSVVNVEVIGASSVDRHGGFLFTDYYSHLPTIQEENFLEIFNLFLKEQRIDFIFPTHDTVVAFLAEHRDELAAQLIAASHETAKICRDKLKTYELFKDTDFCPAYYPTVEDIPGLPVFAKPREGQGSVGARCVSSTQGVAEIGPDDIVTEFLPGKELTVDCLTDHHGKLRVVSPRERQRIMAGICVRGITREADSRLRDIAEKINARLAFMGLWFFQVKEDACGNYKLLEVAARCAGTMCITRARGYNLPLLSLYVGLKEDFSVIKQSYEVVADRALLSRYRLGFDYDTVYMDFDDTVIVRGRVNLNVIRFVYQCRNQGKRVILLTRHDGDINEALKTHALSENLFHEIIHLGQEDDKIRSMKADRALLVDNAFAERLNAVNQIGIPVFDVDTVEALLDWRC
jgi:hypothetical protein